MLFNIYIGDYFDSIHNNIHWLWFDYGIIFCFQ